jgi:hypothetical protein
MEGKLVAMRSLPSVLTTEDARTRAVWLQDTRWLQVLGGGAGEEKGVHPHSAWNPSTPIHLLIGHT